MILVSTMHGSSAQSLKEKLRIAESWYQKVPYDAYPIDEQGWKDAIENMQNAINILQGQQPTSVPQTEGSRLGGTRTKSKLLD